MKATKVYRGEYEVKHNGQVFTIRNMETHSVDTWDGCKEEKWYIYNDTNNEFIAAVDTKKYAMRIVARQN